MSQIDLNHDQEALLARIAAASDRSKADILDEALSAFARDLEEHDQWVNAQMTALAQVWDNDDDTVYDRL